jgi:hypothetical protein
MSADAQPNVLDVRFPTRRILAIIGDKWTTVVLYCLSIREHRRFNELQKQIPDISKKMLIQTLRNLERQLLDRIRRRLWYVAIFRRSQPPMPAAFYNGASVDLPSLLIILMLMQESSNLSPKVFRA